MVVGDGFEPSKAVLADLQSAPFGHSGIPPVFGAGNGGRTRITSLEGWCTAVMPYPQYGHFNQRPTGIDSQRINIGADGGS